MITESHCSDVVVFVRYLGYTRRAVIRQYRINPGWRVVKWLDMEPLQEPWQEPPLLSRVRTRCRKCHHISDAHQKKFDKLVAKIELAKVNPAGLKDPFAVIRKNDNKSKRHREQGGRA